MARELLGEIFEESLWGILAKLITGGTKEAFSMAAEGGIEAVQGRSKKSDEYRSELAAWINKDLRDEDPNAADNLIRRWTDREQNKKRTYYIKGRKPPYEAGSEYFMINVLGKIFEHLDPEKESEENREREAEARMELFKTMGNMTDEEFDSFLVVIHNDTLEQWIVKIWETASKFGKEAYKTTEKVSLAAIKKLREAHDWLEGKLPEPDEVEQFVRDLDSAATKGLRSFNTWANNWLDSKGVSQ